MPLLFDRPQSLSMCNLGLCNQSVQVVVPGLPHFKRCCPWITFLIDIYPVCAIVHSGDKIFLRFDLE